MLSYPSLFQLYIEKLEGQLPSSNIYLPLFNAYYLFTYLVYFFIFYSLYFNFITNKLVNVGHHS